MNLIECLEKECLNKKAKAKKIDKKSLKFLETVSPLQVEDFLISLKEVIGESFIGLNALHYLAKNKKPETFIVAAEYLLKNNLFDDLNVRTTKNTSTNYKNHSVFEMLISLENLKGITWMLKHNKELPFSNENLLLFYVARTNQYDDPDAKRALLAIDSININFNLFSAALLLRSSSLINFLLDKEYEGKEELIADGVEQLIKANNELEFQYGLKGLLCRDNDFYDKLSKLQNSVEVLSKILGNVAYSDDCNLLAINQDVFVKCLMNKEAKENVEFIKHYIIKDFEKYNNGKRDERKQIIDYIDVMIKKSEMESSLDNPRIKKGFKI